MKQAEGRGSMTDGEAVRVLVVSNDVDAAEDFRHILTPGADHCAGTSVTRLEAELFGMTLDHEAFPEVDLLIHRDGEQGVQALRRALDDGRPIPIAFVDLQLAPGLDWLQTAEQMRASDGNLQLVMLAGRCDIHPLDLSLKVPPADRLFFIQKPVPALEVKQLVYVLNAKWRRERALTSARRSAIRAEGFGGRATVAAIQHQAIATMVFDAQDGLLAANPEFARLFPELTPSLAAGLSYEDVSRLLAEHLPGDDTLRTKDGWLRERLDWHARGGGTMEQRFTEGRYVLLYEHADPHELTFCHFLDISDVKRSEQDRTTATQMTAIAQAFSGLCERLELLDSLQEPERGRSALKSVAERRNSFQTILESKEGLVHRLLAIAQRLPLKPEPADLNRELLEAIHEIGAATRDGVEIRAVEAVGLWEVLVDKRALATVLAELLRNAMEALSASAGQVTVEASNVRLSREAAVARSGINAGDYVRLTVQDNGPGMPEELVRRALNPFFSSKKNGLHHGLGLSAAYGFARQSGGQLELHSTVGRGTRVELYFPRLVVGHQGLGNSSGIVTTEHLPFA